MIAEVENGVVKKLKGDPAHPVTQGFICKKMRSYPIHVESTSRVLYPQLRVGEKGEGKFKRITWDEAWKLMVTKLSGIKKKYGGEALLPFSYGGNMGIIQRTAGYPFFYRYGASRLEHTICSSAASAGWKGHCGEIAGSSMEQAEESQLIIIWGSNTKVTNLHFWPSVNRAKRKGAKVVVIDPYRNKTAKAADLYLPVKPGGDAALALAIIKYLQEKGGLNKKFIENSTAGFEELSHYLVTISWQELEQDSGLTVEQIFEFAELIKTNPACFLRVGFGISRNSRGSMSVRAITCLAATLGLFAEKKGQGVLLSSSGFKGDADKINYSNLAPTQTRLINMVQLGEALTSLKPKIHALFVYSSNPASVCPDSSKVREGLARKELFTIVHEQVMTTTARFADLLLPATTFLENSDILGSYGHHYLAYSQAVIPPKGECLTNFELFQTLAQKFGYQEPPFQQSLDQRIDDYLSDLAGVPADVDWEQFRQGEYILSTKAKPGKPKFSEDNRFNFSLKLTNPDISPIPCLLPAGEFHDPDLKSRYPFQLITPPNSELLNSTLGGRYIQARGNVLIHPLDAKEKRIKDGEMVTLKNGRGQTKRRAKISIDTQLGLLVAEGIYWPDENGDLTGINDLTSQNTTDLGGGGIFHESLVDIYRS
jgi:anaerobic selenocysteine-containing dehydrogenase